MDSLLDKKDDNFNYFKEPDWQGYALSVFIIYMTKLLQSDWLRGVQLFH